MKTTYLVFLLDETGSMQSIADDTIGGFNAFLNKLAPELPWEITIIKWDSNRREIVCAEAPLASTPRLSRDNYNPGAATPLVDVVCATILKTAEKVADRDVQVQIVIQTDGVENASTEHSTEELHRLVKEKTALGWNFTFLGAGIDAFAAAKSYGISEGNTVSYARSKSGEVFSGTARSVNTYASTGSQKMSWFTKKEREASGDPNVVPDRKAPDEKSVDELDW